MKHNLTPIKMFLTAAVMISTLGTASATKNEGIIQDIRDVNITKDISVVKFTYNNKNYVVERNQDTNNTLKGGFSKTSRMCPPFCVQPIIPVPGVKPVAEKEVIEFMINELQNNTGVLIDARTPGWYKKGTIPGSVNIPFTSFENGEYHPALTKAFEVMGGKLSGKDKGGWNTFLVTIGLRDEGKVWDFSNAKKVVLWCNGMWCGQSPRAIRAMIKHGFPVEKIHYYRGGMQSWQILGLSVIVP